MGLPYKNFRRIAAAVTFEQAEALKRIAERKGMPQQELIREGIEMVIKKHKRKQS